MRDRKFNWLHIALVLVCYLFSSCLSTNGTLSSRGIEKRRYTKGYHINILTKKVKILEEAAMSCDPPRYDYSSENRSESDDRPRKALRKAIQKKVITAILDVTNIQSDSAKCGDIITFRDGKLVTARVSTIGIKDITYQRCDNLSGPEYTVKKSDVLSIEYSNGDVDEFELHEEYYSTNVPEVYYGSRQTDGFAIASFTSGILAILATFIVPVATLILMVTALIFASVALKRIRRSNGELGGKGLAIAGMVLGIVIAAFVVAALTISILWWI